MSATAGNSLLALAAAFQRLATKYKLPYRHEGGAFIADPDLFQIVLRATCQASCVLTMVAFV